MLATVCYSDTLITLDNKINLNLEKEVGYHNRCELEPQIAFRSARLVFFFLLYLLFGFIMTINSAQEANSVGHLCIALVCIIRKTTMYICYIEQRGISRT